MKSFKTENQNDKGKINELRDLLENLFSSLNGLISSENELDPEPETLSDCVDFVSYVLSLNKEYKIGVARILWLRR